MKREMSKFLCILLILSTVGFAGVGTAAATESSNSTNILNMIENEQAIDEVDLQSSHWRTVLRWAFKRIIGGVRSPFNYSPETNFGSARDTVNSGSVVFNSGSNGFNTVVKDVYGQRRNHQIEMWGNSQQVLYVGKIGVVLVDPSRGRPINRTVGHNQYSIYTIPSNKIGTYEAQFNSTNKHKWRLWIGYVHRGTGLSSATYNIINRDSSIDKYEFTDIGDKRYLVPSKEHTTSKNSITSGKTMNNPINFSELYEQFYDLEHQSLVDVPKDYKAGDTIYINDDILDIHYNDETDETEFSFSNKDELVETHFAGDLTERFNVADNVTFKFKLLPVTEKHDFVIIDYNQFIIDHDKAPDIDHFFVK